MTKSNAQNLLINRIPSVLYKYVPPKLIKSILQDHTIRCTQPADFSDMFDSTHTADPTGPTLNVFGNQFYFLPVDPVTGLPSQRAKDECVAWVKKSVALYPGFEVRAVLAIPDTPGGNVPTREGFNAHWQLLIPRVICLCESPVGIKMWDHYASGHKGFAIGFRTDCAIFNDQDGSSNLKKVVYSTTGSTGPSEVGLWRKWII